MFLTHILGPRLLQTTKKEYIEEVAALGCGGGRRGGGGRGVVGVGY